MIDLLARLSDALADRYAVESEIGRGGMATVYLAEDLRHERNVAIKVLHPELAASLGTDRFLREIKIAAGLNHPHILPLFDSGEAAGLLYFVMPLVEGESLQERLETEGQLQIDEAVGIAAEVAEGLDYAHRQGVIHRDIKPGNILLSEGHALIADFGVARAIGAASDSEATATATGLAVGTPTYMSPEQATADSAVDGRSDIYALGCVLWEMLAGEPPFGGPTPKVILARKAVEEAPDVRAIRSRVTEPLEVCLEAAIASSPADRFATAGEFANALRDAVILGVTPQAVARRRRKRRRRWVLAGAAAVVAVGGVLAWRAYVARQQVQWARTEAVPEIKQLSLVGYFDSALALAERAESILPGDTALEIPWHSFSQLETIVTDPPAARTYRRSLGTIADTSWHFMGTTPLDSVRVPNHDTRWRFEKDGYVTRDFASPQGGGLGRFERLDPLDSIPPGMVRVNGLEVEKEKWQGGPPEGFTAGDYFLDRFEVTNRQYLEFMREGGYESERFWVEPLEEAGSELAWEEAIGRFVDQTGRAGPSTWENGVYPDGRDEYPVGGVSWYEAAAYARFVGKSLPSVWHLDVNDDQISGAVIPNSNMGPTEGPVPVGSLQSIATWGTYDQWGNVREWVYNRREDGRLSIGGGWSDADHMKEEWDWRTLSPWDRSPENGMRLVVYPDTAGLAIANSSFPPKEENPFRDYYSETPAEEGEYETYARLYEYERAALNSVVELSDTVDGWPMERISFTGPDSTRRMRAYVFFPPNARPPYQTVLVWTGYGTLLRRFEEEHVALFNFFLKAGLAVAQPVLTGTFSPIDPEYKVDTSLGGVFFQSPEMLFLWIKELRRTLDYLETRPDIDKDRLAYYGSMIGAINAPIILALEPRIRASIVESAALQVFQPAPPPEVDPFHFLPRVRSPVLIMNSRYSLGWPYATSQLPMLEFLGTPEDHKRLVAAKSSDPVPNWALMREAIPWLNKYLGSVEGF